MFALRCRHRGHHRCDDHGAEGQGHSELPGEKHLCADDDCRRGSDAAKELQPRLPCLRVHILHRSDDHLLGVAHILLHPEDQIHERARQEPGEWRRSGGWCAPPWGAGLCCLAQHGCIFMLLNVFTFSCLNVGNLSMQVL